MKKKVLTSYFLLLTSSQKGFTLVEILVTVSVMAMLSSALVLHNRSNQSQLVLYREQAKIINTILRAKSLALNTYDTAGAPCAYGVHFGKDSKGNWEYRIFQDLDANSEKTGCSTDGLKADNKYSGGESPNSEDLDLPIVEKLSSGIKFSEPLGFTDIVFIPPDPTAVITPIPADDSAVLVITSSNRDSKKVKINLFGQVTTN